MRPTQRRTIVAIAAAGVLALGAVVGVRVATAPGPLTVSTDPNLHYTSTGDYGSLKGTLHAARSGNRACFWVETPPGANSISKIDTDRYYRVLPSDWSADEALRLLHGFRQVAGQPGDQVGFQGAPSGIEKLSGCPTAGVSFYAFYAVATDPA